MARPVSIRDDVILKAARELFLKRGLDATTGEIAQRAGVSHGTVFKRFKTKQALFHAAMSESVASGQWLPLRLEARIGEGEVKETMIDLGMLLVEKFLNFIPMLMMAWSNKQEAATIGQPLIEKPSERAARAMRAVQAVTAYLVAEARLGRIRNVDFEIVAQMFIGALWHYAFLQVTLGGARKRRANRRAYVGRLVGTIWPGMDPQSDREPKT
jgi:AcrR family transcriptional regulator